MARAEALFRRETERLLAELSQRPIEAPTAQMARAQALRDRERIRQWRAAEGLPAQGQRGHRISDPGVVDVLGAANRDSGCATSWPIDQHDRDAAAAMPAPT